MTSLSHVGNPLARPDQLSQSTSQLAGLPRDLEDAVRYRACCVIQSTGILLRLPQTTIAETIVVYSRFWLGPGAPSLFDTNAMDIVAASIYLITKTGPYPLSPRQVLNALYYALALPDGDAVAGSSPRAQIDRMPTYTEAKFEADRAALVRAESHVLRVLGFNTHATIPFALCINYLQTLSAFDAPAGDMVAQRAHAHLNTLLFSPQLVYLTHQPHALAVAAIYLAARECEVSLPGEQWWEVFDVDREELGFLVVALTSTAAFVEAQSSKTVPLSSQALKESLAHAS